LAAAGVALKSPVHQNHRKLSRFPQARSRHRIGCGKERTFGEFAAMPITEVNRAGGLAGVCCVRSGTMIEETFSMSMQSHNLSDLVAKHRDLENQINEELQHPGSSDFRLAELKRRKLQLKDEIVRLQDGPSASVH
jgi:hypothetical protein